jgi:hypothetical protein
MVASLAPMLRRVEDGLRILVRPLGYLAFVIALFALSTAARLLGERHELGFFSARLARTVWRYPEVTRRGVQIAWTLWVVLFALTLSPLDPFATRWDEAVLAVVGALALWHHFADASRAER